MSSVLTEFHRQSLERFENLSASIYVSITDKLLILTLLIKFSYTFRLKISGLPELTLHVGHVMCYFFYFEERLGPASEVRNIYDTTAYLQIILSRLKTVIQRSLHATF